MHKLLVICGPTATGKTNLALKLAKKFDGEVISADSRQVYTGFNIGTGKDLPANSEFRVEDYGFKNASVGYYLIDGVKVWGYDLAGPTDEFSVADFERFATPKITKIANEGKLPILVGGTGLYMQAVIDGIDTIVPPNKTLRSLLADLDVDKLYERLALLNATKAASLNISDKKNPRRLIRAIEVADFYVRRNEVVKPLTKYKPNYELLLVGLNAEKPKLNSRISERVKYRLANGFLKEVKALLAQGVTWSDQAMQSLGYKQARQVVEGGQNIEEFVAAWTLSERQYVKRQMTWFNKDKRIIWFDIASVDMPKNVEKLVKKWYSSS